MSNMETKLDPFTQSYISAEIVSCSSCDKVDFPNPQDERCPACGAATYGADRSFSWFGYSRTDISDATLNCIYADCAKFQQDHADLGGIGKQAGHDFWLTRNHHGAGFRDGDWNEPEATQLTRASHSYGEFNLYLGDDGLIYGQ